jgi:transcriptional regulator with XRE-family HTH domain
MAANTDLDGLGRFLREAREESGMSQRETAEAAGISPTYMRVLEAGSNPNTKKPSRPSPAVLRAIGGALTLDPNALFELAGYDPDPAKKAPRFDATAPTSVEGHLRRMRDAAKKLSHRSPFIYTQTLERLAKFDTEFSRMADGTYRCAAEEEQFLTRMAYRQANSTIKAVSYQDEKWWASRRAREYLRLHAEVRKQGIEITRIFLVSEETQPELRETLEKHIELGIPTFVMSPDDAGDELCRDLVIFDEDLLLIFEPGSGERRTAQFTDNSVDIAQADADFRALHRIAINTPTEAEHILEQMG